MRRRTDLPERDMAGGRFLSLMRLLRVGAPTAAGPDAPDAQLLERFLASGDEAAFEALAGRHGPMVLGVCRRVLGDADDAEDALQATFLVLARKAASAARHRSAGGWLYTVAWRVALRARARRAARAGRERPLEDTPPAAALGPDDEAEWREVRRVIDEEVARLPAKYRVPFVLFHLEGRSSAEVARELGCPVGTVESWLTRARQRLRAGLTRRGLAPASAALAALAPPAACLPRAAAAARAALAAWRGTTGAVSAEADALAAEAVRALGTAKAKVAAAAALLLAAATVAAVGLATRPAPPAQSEPPTQARPAPVPRAAAPVELGALPGHGEGTNAIALSPDGLSLASGGNDSRVMLWDVEKRQPRATLREAVARPWFVQCVAFSPDGKVLASGGNDKAVTLWDLSTGQAKAAFEEQFVVYSVAFSPDGKSLAVAGGAQPDLQRRFQRFDQIPKDFNAAEIGAVTVWDLATGRGRVFFQGETGRVFSVAFSPDGKTLAGAVRDGTVRLWDVATGGELACFRDDGENASSVAFSPDGKTLASGSYDKKVRLRDAGTGKRRAVLECPGGVRSVAFSPDGRALAAACWVVPPNPRPDESAATEVRLWDAATGRPLGAPLTCRHGCSSLAFGAGGTILAVAVQDKRPGQITLWRLGGR
jgi:RNA polymerase sigma factor (sigma-70 family)